MEKKNMKGRLLAVIVTLLLLQPQLVMANGCQVTSTVELPGGCCVITTADCQVTTRVEQAEGCQVTVTAEIQSDEQRKAILNASRLTTEVFLNRADSHYSLGDDLIFGDIARMYAEGKALCCASYVACVLYSSGVLSAEYINKYNYQWAGDGGIPTMLADAGWQQISPSQALPGDVIVDYYVNAMIYAGNGKVWDHACVWTGTATPYLTDIDRCQVWRAPTVK